MVTTQLPTTTSIEFFESMYRDAEGDASRIPWADLRPHPALIAWLNAVAPSLIRCGSRVCVVGCGLGDDAREVISRGYEVLAFDCAPTAIRWAQKLDPANAASYVVADLFDPPARWRHRFELVIEVNTLQSLVPDQREAAMQSLAEMVARNGYLLVICRGAHAPVDIEDGPPWAITESELVDLAAGAGLVPREPVCSFEDDESPPVCRMRALFRRA